jgi:hypothetical protein
MAGRDRRASRTRNIQEIKMTEPSSYHEDSAASVPPPGVRANDTNKKTVRQFVNSRRVYELNIDSHPVAVKPTWSLTHSRDGSPVSHGIAAIETSVDGMSARLITHDWPGLLTVTVTLGVHPRTTIVESFQVEIEPIPDLSSQLAMTFSQRRDRPI